MSIAVDFKRLKEKIKHRKLSQETSKKFMGKPAYPKAISLVKFATSYEYITWFPSSFL